MNQDGIIRWSPNTTRDEFMVFNVNNRTVHQYEATGFAQPGRIDCSRISKHSEVPAINTYDWSPVFRGLVSVGTSQGNVHLLRVDDNSNASLQLPLKLQRPCQSVAFNTTGLLAVGLDRVRNDNCLQIWDVNERLGDWDSSSKGWTFSNNQEKSFEPRSKLEGSTSITSIRFFEDSPQTLVAGVKGQSVRVHDLRDPNSAVINFQTKCNNNIAIDYLDTNYFASSNLDQPGLIIWDRRASSRGAASPMYVEAIDDGDVPWGSSLQLKRAIAVEKNVYVKQLRFSRENRGHLGVLSSAGELKILQTRKDFFEPGSANDVQGSPELLEVRKSYDLQYPYFYQDHRTKPEDRFVSFDWLSLGTSDLQPRVIALRANGRFEILQMPATTANQLAQLIPWEAPHRQGDPYLTLLNFKDPEERDKMLGPLYATATKAGTPVFGPDGYSSKHVKAALEAEVKQALESSGDPVVDLLAPAGPNAIQYPDKSHATTHQSLSGIISNLSPAAKGKGRADSEVDTISKASDLIKVRSNRELHDASHYSTIARLPMSKPGHNKLDHVMRDRAMAGYLFDIEANKMIVSGDRWLIDVWEWIEVAEETASEDGMVSGPLDLSFMGVHAIWTHSLGEKSHSRLVDSTIIPDENQWEHLIAGINKKAGRADYQGVATLKPHHRQLCLATCGLLMSPEEIEADLKQLEANGKYTTAAAWALFEGLPELAVQTLSSGGKDLLFVAVALDVKLRSDVKTLQTGNTQWTKAIENNPEMAEDPYLRAIYGYIATGDWTVIADETSLPLRDRVWIALRYFDDEKLTAWLSKEMEEAIEWGDIEGIVLAGITDNMADIFARYIEKFMDYQTPVLIMSYCYPRYIDDVRCDAWRKAYKDFLQRHQLFVLRVRYEVLSSKKSRTRAGVPVIKPPPRQVTIRCLNCDSNAANDLKNSGAGTTSSSQQSAPMPDQRNPLMSSGINSGLACPKCGAHLPRCAICMEIVGVPRSDRPEQSTDPMIRRASNFPSFCLKCKHVAHLDHARAWFTRHNECPVPECRCQCNDRASRDWH